MAFGLPSTVPVQGNQPLSRELQAVLCAQAWKPGSQHAGGYPWTTQSMEFFRPEYWSG